MLLKNHPSLLQGMSGLAIISVGKKGMFNLINKHLPWEVGGLEPCPPSWQ